MESKHVNRAPRGLLGTAGRRGRARRLHAFSSPGLAALGAVAVVAAVMLLPASGGIGVNAQARNAAAAALTNPVPSTPESIAAGRQLYSRLCVRCHGPLGKGDGGGAGAGGQPADFTDATWEFGGSDGEIFTSIKDGTSADMDAYGERIKETEIWQLVNYLKSLGPGAKE